MMIYTHTPKSKKRKPNAQQRQLAAEWDVIVKKYAPKKVIKQNVTAWKPAEQHIRQTPHYPSLNDFTGSATKAAPKVYTGEKIGRALV